MPGSRSVRATSSSRQLARLPPPVQLPTVTPVLSGSAALSQSMAATGQQAPDGLRRASSRKRDRTAAQGQKAAAATLAAPTETAPAPTSEGSLPPAQPAPSLSKNDATVQTVEASLDASSENAVLDPQQAGNASRRNARRRPQQSKTAAVKQEDQAAPLNQQDQAVAEQLGSAVRVNNNTSDILALPSADDAQAAAGTTDKPTPKRKARQSKVADDTSAAHQNGHTSDAQAAAAPSNVKLSKRAKIDRVVADTSAAIAQEAAAQVPAVAQAPAAGVEELKPQKKRTRPAKKAAPPPTDAADGDVSASEASAAEGELSASEAPAGLSIAGPSGDSAASHKVSKPRKRASRTKKAAAPDAAGGEAGVSEAAVAGSDASVSDDSVSVENAAGSADDAGAGKASKPRKRAPHVKKAAAPTSAAAPSMSEASKAGPREPASPAGQPSSSETSCDDIAVTGNESVKKVVKSRRKFKNELTTRLIAAARAALAAPETVEVPPLPVPNLGYACLNTTLQSEKPPVTSNRSAILRTYNEKGLVYISQLALQNCKDLLPIVQWNHEHSIRLFRLSSDLFPWGDSGKYKLEELPDLPEIAVALAEVGALARLYQQRLTSHPSAFVKMAAQKEDIVCKSIWDLELHSQVFNMMGFPPSMWNKINIHIGGTYGKTAEDKQATLERFIVAFERLSPDMKKRLAVENDDKASQWSITDLLPLHDRIGVPITFDFHHHRFCKGGLTEEQAFKAAIATWPKGVRPQVHWSEEPEDETKARHAHSKYIRGPMNLYGHEADVDIMVEAKAKELTVLDFRNTAQLDVSLPTVAGTLDTQELVRTEYKAHVGGAQQARLAAEAAEVEAAAVRAEEAAAAEAAGATKFL